jgi:hypothetical protein
MCKHIYISYGKAACGQSRDDKAAMPCVCTRGFSYQSVVVSVRTVRVEGRETVRGSGVGTLPSSAQSVLGCECFQAELPLVQEFSECGSVVSRSAFCRSELKHCHDKQILLTLRQRCQGCKDVDSCPDSDGIFTVPCLPYLEPTASQCFGMPRQRRNGAVEGLHRSDVRC